MRGCKPAEGAWVMTADPWQRAWVRVGDRCSQPKASARKLFPGIAGVGVRERWGRGSEPPGMGSDDGES
jgi:hypothetical protein